MLRPVEMSFVTIYINRDLIPIFIKDLIQIKNFQLVNPELSYPKSNGTDEFSSNVQGILSQVKYKELFDQMIIVHSYINEILTHLDIDPLKIPVSKSHEDDLNTFNFVTIDDFINDLQAQTENVHFRLKRISEGIYEVDEKLKESAKIAGLLNLLSKFGGEHYKKDFFKRINFELYTTSQSRYREISHAILHLNSPIVHYGENIGSDIIGFYVFYEKQHEESINNFFLTYDCQKMDIPPKYMENEGIKMELVQGDHKNLIERRERLTQAYDESVSTLPPKIMAFYETLENAEFLLNLIKDIQLTPSPNIVKIQGFIPKHMENGVTDALKNQFKTNIKIESRIMKRSDPYEENDKEEEDEESILKVPTLVKKNIISKPFSTLVELYGTTNYSEIDPSAFLLLTFPLLFGLMFGDAGHGISLIIAGFLMRLKFKKSKPGIANFSVIIIFCGLGAVVGGLLYGEFFGEHLGIVLLFNPIENIVGVIKMSIILGVSIIVLGWLIKFFNLMINRRKFLAFTEPLVKIAIIMGGTSFILTYNFKISEWFAPPQPILWVLIPSVIFIVMKPIGKIFRISYLKKSVGGLIGESLLDFSETMLQIISNVASFVRILALEMAHIGLMIVVSEIVGILETPGAMGLYVVKPLILILGNTFVIILELILVMIHGMRLHFYEFFSKFFVADGIKFQPMKISNKHSKIKFVGPANVEDCFDFYCED